MKLNLKRLIPVYATVLAMVGTAMMSGCGGSKAPENNIDKKDNASDKALSETADDATEQTTEDVAPEQADEETEKKLDAVISAMSMDEKISQLIIPAIRTWNEENVTDLGAVPELASVLRSHQYGGIILFGRNIARRRISALNAGMQQAVRGINGIGLFIGADEEGGGVSSGASVGTGSSVSPSLPVSVSGLSSSSPIPPPEGVSVSVSVSEFSSGAVSVSGIAAGS